MSGSGISWAICKSAPSSRQITMPAPHHTGFYRPDALPAAQPTASKHWRQERNRLGWVCHIVCHYTKHKMQPIVTYIPQSVCPCVCVCWSPPKALQKWMRWTNQGDLCGMDTSETKEPCIGWGPRWPQWEKANLGGISQPTINVINILNHIQ